MIAVAGLGLLATTANAAPPGPASGAITISPETGTTHGTGSTTFTAASACPAGSTAEDSGSVIVLGSGAGFAPDTVLVSPNPVVGAGPQTASLGNTFNQIASNQSPPVSLPLSGTLTIRMQCLDLDLGTSYADFTSAIQFTPTSGIEGNYEVVLPPTPEPPPPVDVEGTLAAGEALSFNTTPTAGAPVGTSVAIPVGGTGGQGSIYGQPVVPHAVPGGFTLLGRQVNVTAPAQTAANPLVLTFTLDSSLVGAQVPTVFRNGTAVASCAGAGPAASPDPCLASATPVAGEDLELVIRSSQASIWSFALPPASVAPSTGGSEQNISVLVAPEATCDDFLWSIIGSDTNVRMSDAVNTGTFLQSTGSLRPISVTDCRVNQPAWAITGSVGDFEGVNGTGDPVTFEGKYLGWQPQVISPGAGGGLGLNVLPGDIFGTGLSQSRTMVSAVDGHQENPLTGEYGAALELRMPLATEDGLYAAVLTLTALT